MIVAVLDTNVLASAVVGIAEPASAPGTLLRFWGIDAFRLVVSEHILTELARTLTKPYFLSRSTPEEQRSIIDLLRHDAFDALHTSITTQVIGVAPTLADDLVLAIAVSGEADYPVTGDRQFRALNTFKGAKFMTPRKFCELLESETSNS